MASIKTIDWRISPLIGEDVIIPHIKIQLGREVVNEQGPTLLVPIKNIEYIASVRALFYSGNI